MHQIKIIKSRSSDKVTKQNKRIYKHEYTYELVNDYDYGFYFHNNGLTKKEKGTTSL